MVGDLWHYGHANFCKQARALGDYLIVGINRDEHCISYKRKPILSTIERVRSAQGALVSRRSGAHISRAACKYVDEVVWEDTELVITKEFIQKQCAFPLAVRSLTQQPNRHRVPRRRL